MVANIKKKIGMLFKHNITIDIKAEAKPALVSEGLSRFVSE